MNEHDGLFSRNVVVSPASDALGMGGGSGIFMMFFIFLILIILIGAFLVRGREGVGSGSLMSTEILNAQQTAKLADLAVISNARNERNDFQSQINLTNARIDAQGAAFNAYEVAQLREQLQQCERSKAEQAVAALFKTQIGDPLAALGCTLSALLSSTGYAQTSCCTAVKLATPTSGIVK